jgi:hypothetical protein
MLSGGLLDKSLGSLDEPPGVLVESGVPPAELSVLSLPPHAANPLAATSVNAQSATRIFIWPPIDDVGRL